MRTLSALVLTLAAITTQAAESDSIAEGREIAADRNRGNCYSCHMADGAQMTGNGGPPLMQMQMRFPDREVLKAQIADPRVRNPNTVMPPYGAHGILTARELELVVDYIHSL
ncbi:sulfur oxidation protein SoxX [gamma proteobacterium NOR5-3]|nr:sulfur oxidation protein SoxX [gamma proteobacterium NOR5-3]